MQQNEGEGMNRSALPVAAGGEAARTKSTIQTSVAQFIWQLCLQLFRVQMQYIRI